MLMIKMCLDVRCVTYQCINLRRYFKVMIIWKIEREYSTYINTVVA